MERREMRRSARRRHSRLLLGVGLMLLGAVLLADAVGFGIHASVWRMWPFVLIGLGALRIFGSQGEDREGGVWLLVGGVYGWLSVFHVAGLSWATAWPVLLVGAGLSAVIGSLWGRPARASGADDAP